MLHELKLFILLLLCAQSQAQTYVVGTSYFGANGYIEYIPGDIPIILGQPHDGEIGDPNTSGTPPGTGLIDLPYIHDRGNDNYTKELIPELNDYLVAKTNGKRPHIVINHLYTGILNLVLEKDEAAGDNPEVRNAWEEYHDFMEVAKAEIMQTWGKGHYFEIHGNGVANQWTMVGLGLQTSELDSSDSDIIIDAQTDSTIMNLANTPGVDVMEAIRGNTSIAGVLNARGWKSSPSPQYPSNENNETYFFAGWNTWEHSLRRPVKIDASHIENYWGFMTSSNRDAYADDLSDAMLIYMKEHYNFDLTNITPVFTPDPNKTYYIDAPHHNLRLAADGESEYAKTTSTSTTGADVEWKFVAKGNGSWHIQRAAGGTLPRLRTDNNTSDGTAADMQATGWNGTYTYYDFEKGAIAGAYFITLADGPAAHVRLQIDNSGNVQMVEDTRDGTWESFKITEVIDSSTSCSEGTNLALDGTIVDFSDEQNTTNSVANILDGNTGNRWSASGFPQYAVIDLGAEYNVNQINLATYTNRDYQFTVEGSLASASSGFNMLVDASNNTATGPINSSFSTQTVRYVKLTVTGANSYKGTWSSITDFEIMCAGSSSNKDVIASTEVSNVTIYPNPVVSTTTIQGAINSTVHVYDMNGRLQLSKSISSERETLNLSGLAAGIYYGEVIGELSVNVVKLVKK